MLLPLNGRRIYYDLAGPEAGPVLCITHSLASDSGMWGEQMAPLLQGGWRVLRIDMRALRGGRTQPSLCARERDRSCDPFRIRQQKSETDITNRY